MNTRHYYPFGMEWDMPQKDMAGNSLDESELKNKYTYNGKELVSDLDINLHDYGFRYYDPAIARFTTIDPLAETYSFQTGYAYAANNPIEFIDFMGLGPDDPPKVRIYTEGGTIGHTYISVGQGDNTTVYTYGRYAELGKDKSSARGTTPTGEGVLIKLTGDDANEYISNSIENNGGQAFDIQDANGDDVRDFFDSKLENSDQKPGIGKYKNADNARVIDTYSLLENNCTTISCDALDAGGSSNNGSRTVTNPDLGGGLGVTQERIIKPSSMQNYLNRRSKQKGSGVKNVTSAYIYYENLNPKR